MRFIILILLLCPLRLFGDKSNGINTYIFKLSGHTYSIDLPERYVLGYFDIKELGIAQDSISYIVIDTQNTTRAIAFYIMPNHPFRWFVDNTPDTVITSDSKLGPNVWMRRHIDQNNSIIVGALKSDFKNYYTISNSIKRIFQTDITTPPDNYIKCEIENLNGNYKPVNPFRLN